MGRMTPAAKAKARAKREAKWPVPGVRPPGVGQKNQFGEASYYRIHMAKRALESASQLMGLESREVRMHLPVYLGDTIDRIEHHLTEFHKQYPKAYASYHIPVLAGAVRREIQRSLPEWMWMDLTAWQKQVVAAREEYHREMAEDA